MHNPKIGTGVRMKNRPLNLAPNRNLNLCVPPSSVGGSSLRAPRAPEGEGNGRLGLLRLRLREDLRVDCL